MISEPVLQDRASLNSLVQRAEAKLAARERLPDSELAIIIEKHRGKALPPAITDYLTKHFRGEIRSLKGPKPQSDLAKEFRFGPAANLYDHVLPIFEYLAHRRKRVTIRRRPTKTGSGYRDETRTPSERALEYVLDRWTDLEDYPGSISPRPNPKDDPRRISPRSLANGISEWRGKVKAGDFDFPDDNPNAHPTDEPDSDTSGK